MAKTELQKSRDNLIDLCNRYKSKCEEYQSLERRFQDLDRNKRELQKQIVKEGPSVFAGTEVLPSADPSPGSAGMTILANKITKIVSAMTDVV